MKKSNLLYRNRFLVSRRFLQLALLVLFTGANYLGWKIIAGNYSTALLFGKIYLSDPHAVLQTLFTGLVAGVDVLTGALIILLFYALIAGRAFCSWVCPMNMVTDLALWLRKYIPFLQQASVLIINRKIRYLVLIMGLLLSFMIGTAAFEAVNPISMLYRGIIFSFGLGWTVVLAVFLFDLLVVKNGWCGHLCPLGAFYSITGRYSMLKVFHTHENCTHCMKCFDVCPEPQVLGIIGKKSGRIAPGECTNCGRCIEVCEDDALGFSIMKFRN